MSGHICGRLATGSLLLSQRSLKISEEGSAASLLAHMPWPTQGSSCLIEAPEATDPLRSSRRPSLAVRVGNDGAAAALLKHMLARLAGKARRTCGRTTAWMLP